MEAVYSMKYIKPDEAFIFENITMSIDQDISIYAFALGKLSICFYNHFVAFAGEIMYENLSCIRRDICVPRVSFNA